MNRKNIKSLWLYTLVFFGIFLLNLGNVNADSGGTGMADDTAKNNGESESNTNNSNSSSTSDAHGSTNSAICYYEWKYNEDMYLLQLTFSKSTSNYDSFKVANIRFENKTTKNACTVSNKSEIFSAYNIGAYWKPYLSNKGTGANCYTDAAYKKKTDGCSNIVWDCPSSVCYSPNGANSFKLHYTENGKCPNGYRSGDWNDNYEASDDASNIYGSDPNWDETKDGEKGNPTDISGWADSYQGLTEAQYDELCNVISGATKGEIQKWTLILTIVGVLIFVVITTIEAIKGLVSSDDDRLSKLLNSIKIRAICVIVLLLLPVIVTGVINLVNEASQNGLIGDQDPLCNIQE